MATDHDLQEKLETPSLKNSFNEAATPESHGNSMELRKEFTRENLVNQSYWTRAEDVEQEHAGKSYEQRQEIADRHIEERSAQGIALDDVSSDIEGAIEEKREMNRMFDKLDLPNEKNRDVFEAARYINHHAQPVKSVEEVTEGVPAEKRYNDIAEGYNKDLHMLKSGDVVYALEDADQGSMDAQFKSQGEEIANSKHVYVEKDLFGPAQYAAVDPEHGHVEMKAATEYKQGRDPETGHIQTSVEPTEDLKQSLSEANQRAEVTAPVQAAPPTTEMDTTPITVGGPSGP